MSEQAFEYASEFPLPVEELFEWHMQPAALRRLVPPWERVAIETAPQVLEVGTRVVLRIGFGPLRIRWVAKHSSFEKNSHFCDIQESGPFKEWRHEHHFQRISDERSVLRDSISYSIPGGTVGSLLAQRHIQRKLARMFRYRHDITRNDLLLKRRFPPDSPLRICISGSSGLVGSSLTSFLETAGHTVFRLVRKKENLTEQELPWNPDRGELLAGGLEGFDAVIHLGGESIIGRWSAAKKNRIRSSRIRSTTLLAKTLLDLKRPPSFFFCASAIGLYGDTADRIVNENAPPASDFLGTLCQEWESAASIATEAGIRVVQGRIGAVLTPAGGALASMLPAFRLGMGGPIGSGSQLMSWITLDDLIGGIYTTLMDSRFTGPVNLVSPQTVANADFSRILAGALRRPAMLRLPGIAVRSFLGEMGETILLRSSGVSPARLIDSKYGFLFPELEGALQHLLGSTDR